MEGCLRKSRITGELSISSIIKYRDSIKKFFSIIGKKTIDLNSADFEEFIIRMQDAGAGNSRIANIISAVKWFIRKLQESGVLKELDLEKIKKPRIGRKEVVHLTELEVGRFLGCIDEDIAKGEAIRKIRMMALVILLLESGSRIGEALSVKVSDIDWENREIPIIGKGGKPRILFFRDKSEYWIKRYLSARKSENEFLFLTLDGKVKWSQTDVGRSFRRYKRLSGINKHFVLHTLRHTTATQLALKGVQFNKIQRILGHSRLDTTVKYYIGAVENSEIKKIMQDKFYDFIPESSIAVENNLKLL